MEVDHGAVTEELQQQVEKPEIDQAEQQKAEQAEPQEEKKQTNEDLPQWARKNLWELREAKRQNEAALAAKEQELAELRARVGGEQKQSLDDYVPKSEVLKVAEQVAEQRSFDARCNDIYAKATAEYKDFETTVSNLAMIGGLPPDTLKLIVTDSEAPQKVLYELSKDLNEASRILSLPPIQQARELLRFELKLSQKTETPKTSSAPPPVKTVAGRGSVDTAISDEDDMATFVKKREAQERAKRGR